MRRRDFIMLAGAATLWPRAVRARSYPARPVRIIVGYAAGGSNDIAARLIGRSLSERLGQPFIIENRPGAGTNIATEDVVTAPPDGYTLLMVNPASAINATLYKKLNFVFLRDIALVAGMIRQPLIMLVNPSLPVRTVRDFIAYAKANPGKVNMASAGIGSINHLAGELFKMMTCVDAVHVPYRGAGPALTDMLAGQATLLFGGMASSVEHVLAGKLRALAVTTATRSDLLPDIPTLGEFVPGYEASDWLGLGAPGGTPDEIVGILHTEVNASLADPAFRVHVSELGATVIPNSPAEFRKLIADETEKWARVINFAGIEAA